MTTRCSFNPRIRKGCDWQSLTVLTRLLVSIHASAKDATRTQVGKFMQQRVSIHASAKDATIDLTYSGVTTEFQSTHPQRMRLSVLQWSPTVAGFNPRIRKGCDFTNQFPIITVQGFQSTHPQRMRRPVRAQVPAPEMFQSPQPQRMRHLHIKR